MMGKPTKALSKAGTAHMKLNALLLAAISLVVVGCSQPTRLNEAPISVSGKVSQGGQPVGDVLVSFQPLERGHPGNFPVNPDGTFQGELIPGNYAYFVGKSTAPKSEAALKKIDPKFYEPNLERKVAIEDGQELLIALD
jgi:hypothetical protein